MGVSLFSKGVLLEINGREYTLIRKIDKDLWQLEDKRSGRLEQRGFRELQQLYVERKLVFVQSIPDDLDSKSSEAQRRRNEAFMLQLSDEERTAIKRKRAYVQAILGLPESKNHFQAAIKETHEKLGEHVPPPNWTTVLRWKKRFMGAGNDAFALSQQHHRKGNRSPRYPEKTRKLVEEAIDRFYLCLERGTIQDVVDHAAYMVSKENKLLPESMHMAPPTRRMVRRLIDDIDAYDRYAARYRSLAATRIFRGVRDTNVTDQPLECAEIDHTRADVFVVDEHSGLPMGRPWITVCIDRNTRCILGIHITFAPPSYLSVARCLRHAILPKVDLREQYPEIESEWHAHGVMSRLVVDNGAEFHGMPLDDACLALNIDLQYTPRKTPWFKGQIERFQGTLNRGVAHGVPGTTFSGIFEKGEYDPTKHAVVTYSTFKLAVHKWIADFYHQKPHRGIDQLTPAAAWDSRISPEDIPLPDNLARLDAILGKSENRTLTHKGIELNGLFYNSDELVALRRRFGDRLEVEVRVDEGDLGKVFVIAPDNSQVIEAPCLQRLYASGLSKWQHDFIRRYARSQLDMADGQEAWLKAKADIAELFQADVLRKQKKRGKKLGDKASEGVRIFV